MRMLVAGVGNIFKSDDAFGSHVAAALAREPLPDSAHLIDFGIRSVHLVYELLDGYDVLVLIDTVSQQDGPPGSLYVIEPDLDTVEAPPSFDPHDLPPGGAMALVPVLGGSVDRIVVVGCQPETIDDGLGMSEAVMAAVEPAVRLVMDVIERESALLHESALPESELVEGVRP